MTAARFCAEDWWIVQWSCIATTFRASRKCKLRFITSFAIWWRYWAVAKLELYGTTRCPHTEEMREWLEWQRRDFVEYDVDLDAEARRRLTELAGGQRNVPVLV